MRYLNAAEAARALGIGDKTIRRWLKAGRFPSAIVKANGEYAIPEDEVESLKQHRLKYVHTKTTSLDQSPDVTALAEKLAALEQEVAELRKEQALAHEHTPILPVQSKPIDAMPQKEIAQNRATDTKRRGYNRKKDNSLPDGCILASKFATDHDVARPTFIGHMNQGLGPGLIHGPDVPEDGSVQVKDYVRYEERNKRVRKDGTIETERYLTSNQQAAAIEFWKRHDVSFAECDHADCPCHTSK